MGIRILIPDILLACGWLESRCAKINNPPSHSHLDGTGDRTCHHGRRRPCQELDGWPRAHESGVISGAGGRAAAGARNYACTPRLILVVAARFQGAGMAGASIDDHI